MTKAEKQQTPNRPVDHGRKAIWLCALVLIASAVAVYANSFRGVFLFDDIPHIIDNQKIHTLWPPGHLLVTRRAVLNLSLAINYAWHGLDVWGYHLVNVLVHVLAGLTLFGLVRRTLTTDSLRPVWGERSTRVAFFVAVIWLVHPLGTQSVTYIVQRGEALMGLFYLLTLYALVRGNTSTRPMSWYLVCLMACALGMASKAVMVTAPVVALLYDRTFLAGGFVPALRKRWHVHSGLLLTWGVLFALGIVQSTFRSTPNPYAHVGFSHLGVSPWEYAATQPGVILHYLRLSFWPVGLCLDYNWPVARTLGEIAPVAVAVGVLMLATVVATFRRSAVGFLGAVFFLVLLPTSSVIPIKDIAFEHRMYLPLAALVTLVVCVVFRVVAPTTMAGPVRSAKSEKLVGLVMAAIALALGLTTVDRNRAYHSQEAMWRDVAIKSPHNPRAHLGVGGELQKRGLFEQAMEEYRRALAIDPVFADAWFNLGTALESQGRLNEAAQAYERVITYAPQRLNVYDVLARVLSKDGRFVEAALWYERLTTLEAQNARWQYEWGNALSDAGGFAEAIPHYQQATRLDPKLVDAWINLGNALRRTGAHLRAKNAYQQAVNIAPGSHIAWLNLANTLAGLDRSMEAIKAFNRAIELDPEFAAAHVGLGWALKQAGRTDEAAEQFHEALRLDPTNAAARQGLSALEVDIAAPSERE